MYKIVRTRTYESFFYATDIALCYRVFQETPEVDNLIFQLPVLTAFFSKFEIRLFIEHFFFLSRYFAESIFDCEFHLMKSMALSSFQMV